MKWENGVLNAYRKQHEYPPQIELTVLLYPYLEEVKRVNLHSNSLRLTILLFSGLLGCLVVIHEAQAQEIAQIHYPPNSETLPFSSVYGDLVQDSLGYLWLGTDQGLFSYDGKAFRSFPMTGRTKSNELLDLHQTPKGYLIGINISGQIYIKEPSGDSLTYFHPGDSLSNYLLKVIDYDGEEAIVVANPSDLDKSSLLYQLNIPTKKLSRITSIKRNSRYRSSSLFPKIFQIDNNLFYQKTDSALIPSQLVKLTPETPITNLAWSNLRTIFKTKEKLFLVENHPLHGNIFQIDSTSLERSLLLKKEYKLAILKITIDKEGQIWLLSGNNIYLLNAKIPTDNYTPTLNIKKAHNILHDKENNYWLGTANRGVFLIPNLKTLYFNQQTAPLSSDQIVSIVSYKKQRLIGCADGSIFKWQDNKIHFLTKIKNCEALHQLSIIGDKVVMVHAGNQAYSTRVNISVIPIEWLKPSKELSIPAKNTTLSPVARGAFKCLAGSPTNDTLYIGTSFGSFRLSKSSPDNYIDPYPQLHTGFRTNAIFHDPYNRRFWIGESNGLTYSPTESDTVITFFNKGQEFKTNIQHIHQTIDSTIWIGTKTDGVYGIRGDSIAYHFTQKEGLLSDGCTYLYANESPYLWVGSKRGISRLDIRDKSFRYIDKSDGLLSQSITAIHQQDSLLFAGTKEGLFQIDNRLTDSLIAPPLISITNIKIWNKDTAFINNSLDLPYKDNNLEINFNAISFKSFNNLRQQYRMIGIDSNWVDIPKSVSHVRFPQLSEGAYQFEVKAINSDGVSSKQPAILKINIRPPYWRTGWFIGLLIGSIALISGLIVFFISHYKQRQKEQEYQLLQQIDQLRADALRAQMNPHFIFNALNAILLFLAKNDQKSAIQFLSKFSRLIRYIFEYSHKDSISISEEIQFLEIYLKLEALRFKDKVDIQIEIADSLRDTAAGIPPLLIQPIIENSFKHGLFHKKEAGVLQLRMSDMGETIKVVIEDNGIGREKAAEILRKKKIKRKVSSNRIILDRIAIINQKANDPEKVQIETIDLVDEMGHAAGLRTIFLFKTI